MKKYSLLWVSALLPVLLAATAWADFKAGFEALKKRDYPAALREWRPLAEHGDHRAQAALGLMYYEGEGVEKDYKTAAHWLRKSADQGFAPAQAYLGLMYGKGRGFSPDFKKAVYWYQKAAEQGYAKAQFNPAYFYANGKGVHQDYVQAYMWLELAAGQGRANRNIRRARALVADKMTPDQVAQAQRLARAWKPKKTQAGQLQPPTPPPPPPPVSSYEKQLAALRARIAEVKKEYAAAKDSRRKDELLAEFTKLKGQEAAFIKKQGGK